MDTTGERLHCRSSDQKKQHNVLYMVWYSVVKSCNHAPIVVLPTLPTPNPPRQGQNEKFTFEDLGKYIVLTLR